MDMSQARAGGFEFFLHNVGPLQENDYLQKLESAKQ